MIVTPGATARLTIADPLRRRFSWGLQSLNGSLDVRPARSDTPPAPLPGQASRLLTDHITGAMFDLEDGIRDRRRLRRRSPGFAEGAALTSAVRFLAAHLDWALTDHPAAAEIHDRLSANPAAQIHTWHAAATRFTGRDPGAERYSAPCPSRISPPQCWPSC
ncbi:hypothetical protein [Streptomyces cinnamoneus]|uniref:Uncharacterized protein n=1 Tax=Streptomyces cinnamoneus TaxID=53446 RepID=A0A918TBR3_STRCJ|nr:hypothetical protein [Streptomyces cinnamoneus]GHC39708.1 hypothetical protein GCM10010507_12000 [Streptomyces cinnamoneus]